MFKYFTRSSILLLLCSLFFALQTASAAITPRIDASRVSGVAPLSVFFDASATTSTATGKPFHEVYYAWDFGDTNAGNWQYGNLARKDKNLASGPIAAHVFETPGTYTVRLTTKGLDGVTASQSVSITVQNPDSVFSGNNTICFSSSGNYSSCPSGAQHITTSSFQNAMDYATAGKRLLFRRGESWTASSGSEINNDGPGLIGAFGSGVRPAIHNTSGDNLFQLSRGSSGHSNDWRIMDLDLSSSNTDSELFRADNTVNNLLLLRLKARNFYRFVSIATDVLDYYGSTIHKNIFVVENDFQGSSSHGSYVAAEGLAYMGNRLKDSPNSHVLRITYANPVVISNNSFLGGSGPSHHLLKFHSLSPELDNYTHTYSSSGQFVIADNIVNHGSQGNWAFALGPQSSSGNRPENVRTGIIERNHFTSGANTQMLLMLWTSEVTVRNNLFDQTGVDNAIQISRRNQEDAPHDNSVYSNTFYSANSGNSVKSIVIDSVASNTSIRNNLVYTSGGSGSVFSGSAVHSDNLVMAGLSQSNASRFLPVGKALGGAAHAMVLDDYENKLRPRSAQDIGAYQKNGALPLDTAVESAKNFSVMIPVIMALLSD